jgi:hypothetical protein
VNPTAVKSLCLLAVQHDSFGVWGRFDHARPGAGLNQFAILMIALAAVVMIALVRSHFARRDQREFTSNNSARLFKELCRAHGFDYASRRLLKRLAAAHGVEQPAVLFVEPAYFDTNKLPASVKPFAGKLQQLRNALFN